MLMKTKINLNTNFVQDLGADSLDAVELVMAIDYIIEKATS